MLCACRVKPAASPPRTPRPGHARGGVRLAQVQEGPHAALPQQFFRRADPPGGGTPVLYACPPHATRGGREPLDWA